MSTPYTLMRCRMKDLISCFNACKLPIEKDHEESNHQNPKPSSVIDNMKRERAKKVKVETTSSSARDGRGRGGEESPVSWRSCESDEDDYIVFYFKDDEAGGEVIEERGLDVGCCNQRKKETCQGSTERVRVDAKRSVLEYELEQHRHTLSESSALEYELEQHRHTLSESSESSTGSFAFPIIQGEWTGSPVLMPRPVVGHNKSCGVCVQCCKF